MYFFGAGIIIIFYANIVALKSQGNEFKVCTFGFFSRKQGAYFAVLRNIGNRDFNRRFGGNQKWYNPCKYRRLWHLHFKVWKHNRICNGLGKVLFRYNKFCHNFCGITFGFCAAAWVYHTKYQFSRKWLLMLFFSPFLGIMFFSCIGYVLCLKRK